MNLLPEIILLILDIINKDKDRVSILYKCLLLNKTWYTHTIKYLWSHPLLKRDSHVEQLMTKPLSPFEVIETVKYEWKMNYVSAIKRLDLYSSSEISFQKACFLVSSCKLDHLGFHYYLNSAFLNYFLFAMKSLKFKSVDLSSCVFHCNIADVLGVLDSETICLRAVGICRKNYVGQENVTVKENVRHLDLSLNTKMTFDELNHIVSRYPNLMSLDLNKCIRLSSLDLKILPQLKKLDITSTSLLPTELTNILGELCDIEELIIGSGSSYNHEFFCCVDDNSVQKLASCSKLKKLSLFGQREVGDGLMEVINSCKGLEDLDLGMTSITEATIEALSLLPNLKRLSVHGCVHLDCSNDPFTKLILNSKNLEYLDCTGTKAANMTLLIKFVKRPTLEKSKVVELFRNELKFEKEQLEEIRKDLTK